MAKSLTKEKEKLCRVEEIFQSLIEVKEEVSKKIEKLPPQFNLLENIRNKNSNNSLQRFETYNSDLLHYLLNIKRENINFTNFGICGIPNINNKIKKEVQKIFNNKFKDKKGWDFFYEIDINNDKPQEIAEVMIKLY